MRREVLRESTFHWLTTVVGQPATEKAQLSPTSPSPWLTRPRPVSHADSTARSAGRLISMISHASSRPSSPSPAAGRASTSCE